MRCRWWLWSLAVNTSVTINDTVTAPSKATAATLWRTHFVRRHRFLASNKTQRSDVNQWFSANRSFLSCWFFAARCQEDKVTHI